MKERTERRRGGTRRQVGEEVVRLKRVKERGGRIGAWRDREGNTEGQSDERHEGEG